MRKKTAEAALCKRKLSVLLLGYLYKRNPVMLVQIRAVSEISSNTAQTIDSSNLQLPRGIPRLCHSLKTLFN